MYLWKWVVMSFKERDVVVAHPWAEHLPSGISLLCQYVGEVVIEFVGCGGSGVGVREFVVVVGGRCLLSVWGCSVGMAFTVCLRGDVLFVVRDWRCVVGLV